MTPSETAGVLEPVSLKVTASPSKNLLLPSAAPVQSAVVLISQGLVALPVQIKLAELPATVRRIFPAVELVSMLKVWRVVPPAAPLRARLLALPVSAPL